MRRNRSRQHYVYKTPEIVHGSPIYVNTILDTVEHKSPVRIQHPTFHHRETPFANRDILQHISVFLPAEDVMRLRNVSKQARSIKINNPDITITEDNLQDLLPIIREEKTPYSFTVNDSPVISLLIRQGVSVNVIESIIENDAPVFYVLNSAAYNGRVDIVRMLVERQFVDIFDEEFDFNGGWDINVVQYLIEAGADPNNPFLMETAIEDEAYDTINYLVSIGVPIDAEYIQIVESPRMLSFLLELGMPIDFREVERLIHLRYNEDTPLHMDFIDIILEHEPDFPFEYYMDFIEQ